MPGKVRPNKSSTLSRECPSCHSTLPLNVTDFKRDTLVHANKVHACVGGHIIVRRHCGYRARLKLHGNLGSHGRFEIEFRDGPRYCFPSGYSKNEDEPGTDITLLGLSPEAALAIAKLASKYQ